MQPLNSDFEAFRKKFFRILASLLNLFPADVKPDAAILQCRILFPRIPVEYLGRVGARLSATFSPTATAPFPVPAHWLEAWRAQYEEANPGNYAATFSRETVSKRMADHSELERLAGLYGPDYWKKELAKEMDRFRKDCQADEIAFFGAEVPK